MAYYLSLTIKDPLVAMIWFMVAVVLVILATYLLFIAGSVTFCKIMQKKKGYYYKTNHFISLSSMIYRMKRNGAGLASICILSTMVLVMVSSTTSLYLSMKHGLNLRYPKSVQIEMYTKPEQTEEMKENQNGQIIELVQKVLKEHNQTAENPENYRMLTVSGIVSKNEIYFNPENAPGVNEVNTFDHLKMFYALPLEAYNRIMGTNLELAPGEAYLYAKDSDFPYDQITVENSGTWRIKGHLDKMISNGNNMANMNSSFYLVVPGLEDIKALEEGNVSVYGVNGSYENGTTILICPVEMKSRSRFKTRLTRKSMHWLNRNQRNQIPYFLELLQTAEPHQGLITRLCTAVCSSLESFLESYSFLEWC